MIADDFLDDMDDGAYQASDVDYDDNKNVQ